jgi:hypothetical protein
MGQLYNANSHYLWVILIALIVVEVFVGRKSLSDPNLLVEGGKYNRPFQALEQEPTAKELLFKSWDDDTKRKLRHTLYWDFLFILLYPISTALACFMAERFLVANRITPFQIGLWVLLLPPAAALFDVIENFLLLRIIDGLTSNLWLTIARISTAAKLAFISLAVLYALVGLFAWVCLDVFPCLERRLGL